MITFSGGLTAYYRSSIEKELKDQLVNLADFSKQGLASALWQYNYEYVKDYIDSLFLYEDLVFVQVLDKDTTVFKKARPKLQGLSKADLRSSGNFLFSETEVTFNESYVGTVQLVLSRARVDELVLTYSTLAIILLLVVNLSIFATNIILSRQYIFNPLSSLEASVKSIAGGDLDAAIDTRKNDEIGQLASAFKEMMVNLKKITASRDDLNREVQERKKAERELKASLKEKEVLLKEIHHRVKNNLQMVQSLLNLQRSKTDSDQFKQAIDDSQGRIRSMALIHEILYRSNDFTHLNLNFYFEGIVQGVYAIYQKPDIPIRRVFEVDALELDLDKSIACGLIVNELVTNSLKHAFGAAQSGKIVISLTQEREDEALLQVKDNGSGLRRGMDWKVTDSLGFQIVRILSEEQLSGCIDLFSNEGLSVEIKFPI
jgi:two-component sensor histidine kinase/HAMP domain-containing protein